MMVLLVDPFIKSEKYMVCNEDQGRNKPLIELLSLPKNILKVLSWPITS
jgi:hypothetical protein